VHAGDIHATDRLTKQPQKRSVAGQADRNRRHPILADSGSSVSASCDACRVASRYGRLSQRQLEVLKWVADGSPDGVWTDFTYKTVAYGLAGRHLVVVQRRRNSWRTTTITAQGTYYLQHGSYPQADASGGRRSPGRDAPMLAPERSGPSASVSPQSLIDDLQADGTMTLTDPTASTRAAYRSAISRAITERLVPDGYALRHSGRDRGDLVIRLVAASDLPIVAEKLPEIVVPENLDRCHEAVRILGDADGLLHVSRDARSRALRVAQAVADECERRGYGFGLRDDGKPSFRITIGEDSFDFVLSEELDRRVVPDEEKLAAAKYSWQRIPSAAKDLPSGRLTLLLGQGYGSVSWGDRKRWSLEQKLPTMFKAVADRASAHAQARANKEAEKQWVRQQWEAAVLRARQAYIDQINRDRLRAQVSSSAEAEAIRQYCTRLDKLAADCPDQDDAARIRRWAAWARHEADRVDPLGEPEQLGFEVPEEIRTYDLDKFMPRGMHAWSPPD
jgi:hypothetical protein